MKASLYKGYVVGVECRVKIMKSLMVVERGGAVGSFGNVWLGRKQRKTFRLTFRCHPFLGFPMVHPFPFSIIFMKWRFDGGGKGWNCGELWECVAPKGEKTLSVNPFRCHPFLRFPMVHLFPSSIICKPKAQQTNSVDHQFFFMSILLCWMFVCFVFLQLLY